MSVKANVVCDSEAYGVRLITLEIELHRFILPEFNTHRCVTADTKLWFDISKGSKPKLHKMTVGEFYSKWATGSKEHTVGSKKDCITGNINPEEVYKAKDIAKIVGCSISPLRLACREGRCLYKNKDKARSEDFMILGKDFIDFRARLGIRKFSLRGKLEGMKVRMLNEDTNNIENTSITDIWEVGHKQVYKLTAGGFKLRGTVDHPILTTLGWKELGKLTKEDYIITCGSGVDNPKDPLRHKYIDGKWTTVWNRQNRDLLYNIQGGNCNHCNTKLNEDFDIHHVEPVHTKPELAFNIENTVALHKDCHKVLHKQQGWQTSKKLLGKPVRVDSVEKDGIEMVYDLSVSSNYHNFVANGIVVHNCFSRNFQSSRALPLKRQRELVLSDPAMPVYWGTNKAGMVAGGELVGFKRLLATTLWKVAMYNMSGYHWLMEKLGVHKQLTNRLLEPWMYTRGVVTATEEAFYNFFKLRCDKDAQPEIKALADAMQEAIINSAPKILSDGDWHLPYVNLDEFDGTLEEALKVSTSCCAQVSYRNLDSSIDKALRVYGMLNLDGSGGNPHASPCEHIARVDLEAFDSWYSDGDLVNDTRISGNLKYPWNQYRKMLGV